MANENGKSTDDLLQLICDQWWSVGESHKFNLDQYGVSNAELPAILQKVKDKELDYELNKSSDGRSTLKVYKRYHSNVLKNIKMFIAFVLIAQAMILAGYIVVALLVLVYPFFTIACKLLDNHWIPLDDFWNSYWKLVFGDVGLY